MLLLMRSMQANGTRQAFKFEMKVRIFRRFFPALLAIVFSAGFSACATSPQTLYSWESYETQVYAYLKGENQEAQIEALESDKEKIEASGKAFPPGFYAQLGLLYTEAGDSTMAITCFETEKALFPEAATYMDFILKNYER